MAEATTVPIWRKVVAAILDVITVFFVGGYLIGLASGQTTDTGFNLQGGTALILFAIMIAYFWLLPRYGGGTIWQRILRSRG